MSEAANEYAAALKKKAQDLIIGVSSIVEISSVYTEADCAGPNGQFQTKIWSTIDGLVRFEQHSSRGTTVAGIGRSGGWAINEGKASSVDAATEAFLRGHELHIIAYDPACRYRSLQNAGDANFFGQ